MDLDTEQTSCRPAASRPCLAHATSVRLRQDVRVLVQIEAVGNGRHVLVQRNAGGRCQSRKFGRSGFSVDLSFDVEQNIDLLRGGCDKVILISLLYPGDTLIVHLQEAEVVATVGDVVAAVRTRADVGGQRAQIVFIPVDPQELVAEDAVPEHLAGPCPPLQSQSKDSWPVLHATDMRGSVLGTPAVQTVGGEATPIPDVFLDRNADKIRIQGILNRMDVQNRQLDGMKVLCTQRTTVGTVSTVKSWNFLSTQEAVAARALAQEVEHKLGQIFLPTVIVRARKLGRHERLSCFSDSSQQPRKSCLGLGHAFCEACGEWSHPKERLDARIDEARLRQIAKADDGAGHDAEREEGGVAKAPD